MKKKIVIISNYYPPEIGAAANRISNMVKGLKLNGFEIVVLCPIPNYPTGAFLKGYRGKFKVTEEVDGIRVIRHWIYPTNSKNPIVRFFGMISFSLSLWTSFRVLKKEKVNFFLVNSPPLFVAFSGLILGKCLKAKRILNVSDLWPHSALELGILKEGRLINVLRKIEKKIYKISDKILGQTEGVVEYISTIEPQKETFVYRNVPFFKEFSPKQKNKKTKIVYAGLLGYAQGIISICKNINFEKLGVEFHIYGAGMQEELILDHIENNTDSIFFHGSMSPQEIKNEIRKYDIALVPLYKPIKSAVPSKVFELMQLGVPILYIGEGECVEVVEGYNIGLSSLPGDYTKFKKNVLFFKELTLPQYKEYSNRCLKLHKEKYHLENQLQKLYQFID